MAGLLANFEAQPIITKKININSDDDVPAWKKKQLNNRGLQL